MIFSSAIELLEFPQVLEIIAKLSASEPGAVQVRNLRPKTDIEIVSVELQRVEEMVGLLEEGKIPPFKGIYDLTPGLKTASVAGAMLSAETLLQFASTLSCARLVQKFLTDNSQSAPYLMDMGKAISTFEEVENAVNRAIDETGEIRDTASPELKHIRTLISSEKRHLRELLTTIMKDWSARDLLQEEIIALRDGRFTLPVKDHLKGRVKGIYIDQSSSGQTIFIEPLQIVEINNYIRKLELDQKREIERILREITAIIFSRRFEIEDSFNLLIELDSIFARANYAGKYNCHRPRIGMGQGLKLINARHPLLLMKEKSVVPLNLEFDPSIRTLIISGPNAGGKTVTLKTVGLLTLMAMSGCFIPADKESHLPLPQEIYTIIGDDQSIAADLSTFTAHIARLSKVVETANSHKLVLIDEIMSGTDPTEGAALAIAILERLTSDGALTLVTTHKGDLKAFAQQTEGVLNGSLDFDPETLSPTFQFRVGIPGSSYAFPIAQKAGLPEPIINRAQEVRGSERVSLDNLMLELQEQLLRTTKENLQAEQERRKFQALQNQLEEKLKSASALEYKYKEKAIAEAEKILAQANQAVEQAVRIIKEGEASKEAIKSAHQTIENARASVPARRKRIRSAEKSAPGPITAGDRVRLQDGETAGTVIQNKDSQGRFLVQMGAFKIRAEEAKLIKLEPLKKEKQERVRVKYQLARENIAPEIDLRGLDSQEAATRLEKYLYQAANANFRRIDIIHGKGGGILRKVVSEILSKSDYVKSFRTGGWGEGDFGVTVAELEE